jgi:nucleotide-binding universal stress UspA family protein
MKTFVVGIDDSEPAAGALRWALTEGRLHGARLVVVHAWDWPHVGEFGAFVNERLARADFDQAAAEVLHAMVAAARGPATGDVEVEERVVRGAPAQALLEAAADADLLVVGSRGRGGFAGLLLGSVSQQCTQHAPCPVVIVPPPRAGEAEGRSEV